MLMSSAGLTAMGHLLSLERPYIISSLSRFVKAFLPEKSRFFTVFHRFFRSRSSSGGSSAPKSTARPTASRKRTASMPVISVGV